MNSTKFAVYAKENGFIFQSDDKGHYFYGPTGKKFKNLIENKIRSIWESREYQEVETSLIHNKEVFIYSGHWDKFQDPIIRTKGGAIYRLDHLIKETLHDINYEELKNEEIIDIQKNYLAKLAQFTDKEENNLIDTDIISYRHLMMKTESGGVECGLRPETASSTYQAFLDMYNFNKKKIPMKIFQIGKVFRNEISCKRSILRCREFTQAESQLFIFPQDKQDFSDVKNIELLKDLDLDLNSQLSKQKFKVVYTSEEDRYVSIYDLIYEKRIKNLQFALQIFDTLELFKNLGLYDKIRLRQHADNEKAHYAIDAWDIEINLPEIGWFEIAGIHDRGNYDLTQLFKYKNHPIEFYKDNEIILPHILEVAIGVDRLIYALLVTNMNYHEKGQGKSVLSLPWDLAPIQISILPLLKNKPDLIKLSHEIYRQLQKQFVCKLDINHDIGKRYLKSALYGIPLAITVDFTSLEDETVTIRNRDTEEQIRVKINDLSNMIHKLLYLQ